MRHPIASLTVRLGSLVLAALVAGCGDSGTTTAETFNGCTEEMFVDRTAASASRAVGFGGVGGSGSLDYSPKCILVAAGQTVTFNGAFDAHPLSPGSTPSLRTAGSANNPVRRTSTGSTVTVTYPTAGTYPYFCEAHYAVGMTGVVRVR